VFVEETTRVDRKVSSVYKAEIGMALLLSEVDAVEMTPQMNEGEIR
jgi:hypothetical protein